MISDQNIAIDDIPIAIFIVQRDYQIIVANKQTHILFGYEAGELVGKQLEVLLPPKLRPVHHKMAEEFWKDARPRQLGFCRDLRGVKKCGVEIPVEIGLYPYKGNVMVLVTDITIRYVNKINDTLKILVERAEKTVDLLKSVEK